MNGIKSFKIKLKGDGKIYKFRVSERNADLSGYHFHLLINAHRLTKGVLCYVLDLKNNQIPYYKPVDNKVKVAGYVTKYMKDDQIHYNI